MMKFQQRMAALLVISCVAAFAGAQTTTKPAKGRWKLREGAAPQLQSIIDRQDEIRPAAIEAATKRFADLQQQMKELQKQKPGTDAEKKSRSERIAKLRLQIAEAQKRLQGLKSGDIIALPTLPPPGAMKPGDAGFQQRHISGRVLQVQNEFTLLLHLKYTLQEADVVDTGATNGPRVIREQVGETLIWMTDFNTTGLTDGKFINEGLQNLIAIGTQTYETITGPRTVMAMKTFDPAVDFVRSE